MKTSALIQQGCLLMACVLTVPCFAEVIRPVQQTELHVSHDGGRDYQHVVAPPAPARAAGYFTLTFSTERFGPSNLDAQNSSQAGFQWYPNNWFHGSTPGSIFHFNSDGSLTISPISGQYNGQIATAGFAATAARAPYHGVAFGGGFYAEATLKFDPGVRDSTGCPAWWSMDLEHFLASAYGAPKLAGAAARAHDQWEGQRDNYEHFAEFDFMEYPYGPYSGSYTSTLHEHYGVHDVTCSTYGYCDQAGPDNPGRTPPVGTDYNSYHAYGFLWVPATDKASGKLISYFDGAAIGTSSFPTSFTVQSPPPQPTMSWWMSIADKHHMMLLLGSGAAQPLTIRSVHIWQASSNRNMTN